MIRYCLFTIIYCLQILQAEGCLGSALKKVTSSESLVSGAAALFQHVSAACHTIAATWSLWSGTVQEDGLFSFEDSRQGSDAKHVLVCFGADHIDLYWEGETAFSFESTPFFNTQDAHFEGGKTIRTSMEMVD